MHFVNVPEPTATHYLMKMAEHALCCAICHRYCNRPTMLELCYDLAPCPRGKYLLRAAHDCWMQSPAISLVVPEPQDSVVDYLSSRFDTRQNLLELTTGEPSNQHRLRG